MFRYFLAVVAVTSMAGTTFAGILTTGTASNGGGSIFLNLTAKEADMEITGFDMWFNNQNAVAVYIRPDTYVGFDGNPQAWELWDTVTVTDLADGFGSLVLSSGILVEAGQTVGICLYASGNIRYADSGQQTWANDDLILFSDMGRGSLLFAGQINRPRTFAGNVHYTILEPESVPEPGSLALLGLGLAVCLRRRKTRLP